MDKISDADDAILAEFCENTPKTSPIIKNTTRKRPKISTLKPDVLVFPRDPVREGYVATFQGQHFRDDQIEEMTKTTLGPKNKKTTKTTKTTLGAKITKNLRKIFKMHKYWKPCHKKF